MKRRPVSYQRRSSSSFSSQRAEVKARNKLIVTLIGVAIFGYVSFAWILPAFVGGMAVLTQSKDNKGPLPTPVAESAIVAPPVLNIPYEATNTATIKINGYSTPNTSVEIYIDNDLKTTVSTSSDGSFTTDDIPLNIGNNNISGKTIDDKGKKSLSSKPILITYLNEKPKLQIDQPQDNTTVNGSDEQSSSANKKVTVSGKVDPVEGVTVTINGVQPIVGSDGSFSQTADINQGDNTITITATDMAGNTTQVTRKVTYNP